MTGFHLDIHRVLRALEAVGTFTATWPIDSEALGYRGLVRKLYSGIVLVALTIMIMIIIPYGFIHRDDMTMLMITLSQVNACFEPILDVIMFRLLNHRLLKPVTKMQKFVETAKPHELLILQKYIDRYWTFYMVVIGMFVTCGTAYIFSPILLHTDFPVASWYPFPTNALPVYCAIYIFQIYVIYEVVCFVFVDITIATLLGYSSARIEMLLVELQNMTQEYQLNICIKKHQEIIEFVEDVQQAVGHILFKSNIIMSMTIIPGSLALLKKQPLVIICECTTIVLASLQRLSITAWPADDLREISLQLPWFVYNSAWITKSKTMASNVSFMILRGQKALLLRMNILPALSLKYYADYVKTVGSYFMTMRATIGDQ